MIRAMRRLERDRDDSVEEGLLRHLRTLAAAVSQSPVDGDEAARQFDLTVAVTSILAFAHVNEATWLLCANRR